MTQRILIVGDERKGRVREMAAELRTWLLEREDVAAVDVEFTHDAPLAERRADLVVVLGGDGSMLGAARRMGTNQLPTLGVNLGRVGFLTAFGDDAARDGIERALRGELAEEPRLMLECRVQRADGSDSETVLCLNDAVLGRSSTAGIVQITAARDDFELARYSGDGVIVATPVGSTAYSLASGGPVVSPRLDALVLTPLASHSLTLRPLVVSVRDGIALRIDEAGGGDECTLSIDGQVTLPIGPGDVVRLTPSEHRFRHLTRGPGSFYGILREKFGWADTPRRGR